MEPIWKTRISRGASTRARNSVLDAMKRVRFFDPVSKYFPESGRIEESLSATVALYHHAGRIRWDRVPLRSFTAEQTDSSASTIISGNGIFVPEFPLIDSTPSQNKIWGSMRIDLLYFDPTIEAVGFVDSKLGSPFHYDPTPESIQPARYLDRILQLTSSTRFFIFATSRELFGENGYLPILRSVCEFSEQRGAFAKCCYVIAWEEVIEALAV